MPYLGIFRLEFEKTIVIFEISNLEFLKNDASTHKKPLSYLKSAPSRPRSQSCAFLSIVKK